MLPNLLFLMLYDMFNSRLNDYNFVLSSESRIVEKDVRECIMYVVVALAICKIPGKLGRSERCTAAF